MTTKNKIKVKNKIKSYDNGSIRFANRLPRVRWCCTSGAPGFKSCAKLEGVLLHETSSEFFALEKSAQNDDQKLDQGQKQSQPQGPSLCSG
jgi:hypothetical protein